MKRENRLGSLQRASVLCFVHNEVIVSAPEILVVAKGAERQQNQIQQPK
jgi:hypothetical protein